MLASNDEACPFLIMILTITHEGAKLARLTAGKQGELPLTVSWCAVVQNMISCRKVVVDTYEEDYLAVSHIYNSVGHVPNTMQ